MIHRHRSWGMVAASLIAVSVVFLIAILGSNREIDESIIVPILIIVGFSVLGIVVARMSRGAGDSDKKVKVDKSLEYTFTLVTSKGEEKILEFSQIEKALKELEETRSKTVNVRIEPAMGSICNVECLYRNGAFYTYYLQERKDGKGYWFSVAPGGTFEARYNLQQLFVKHKKIEFSFLNYKKTGEEK